MPHKFPTLWGFFPANRLLASFGIVNMNTINSEQIISSKEKKDNLSLWPLFVIEIVSLIVWAPIAALAGMGYSPYSIWGNILILVFHLYPVYMLIAFPVALSFKVYGKTGFAIFFAILPPLISCCGFFALLMYAMSGS